MRKVFLIILSGLSLFCQAQYDVSIHGEDTLCIGQSTQYTVEVEKSPNRYLFRDTTEAQAGGTGFFALDAGYDYLDITNTFTYDLWVKPTRTINMYSESNACAGAVSVPLANSNQNWAIVPSGLAGGDMSVGLTIGTNGLMVGEHSGNILVSRLSYTVPITDWVHVTIVYDTDNIYLYLDGNLVRSRATHCPTNTKCLARGLTGYYYGPDFKGNIDEFRLWDIALTAGQIQEIKDKKIINQVDGLRYYASFDDGKFERTLGDIGYAEMTVSQITPESHIKQSPWELNSYTGPDVNNLVAFSPDEFNYKWSTGETTQNIYYSPMDTLDYISVQTYTDDYSMVDSFNIIGLDCCEEIFYDTLIVYDTIRVETPSASCQSDYIRYVRFESYYSEDGGQSNVHELECFSNATNIALNKPVTASSTQNSYYAEENAVDGDITTRWSSDRNVGIPDSLNPQHITVDLEQIFRIDSVGLDIKGNGYAWNQTFGIFTSLDSIHWNLIGSGVDTTGVFSYLTLSPQYETIYDTITTEVFDTTFVTIQDTTFVTIIDTVSAYAYISVTDTLKIDVLFTEYTPPYNINSIKVYPNPAKDQLFINTGYFGLMYDYQLKIINQLGAIVFETYVRDFLYEVNLSSWSGRGVYFLQLIDPEGVIIDIKKIVLQ